MKMKKLVIAALLFSATGATSMVHADQVASPPDNKFEKRGAVTGLVVGAALAGPVGATLGSMIGGGIVGTMIDSQHTNKSLTSKLATLSARTSQTDEQASKTIKALNKDLDRLLAMHTGQIQYQLLPVQFKTGSSEIEAHYSSQLEKISGLLLSNKDSSISLSGYADRRGDAAYNQRLSEKRVESVIEFLLGKGVYSHQIIHAAYGESQPLQKQESSENNFFDRRVVLELHLDLNADLATR